MATGCHPEELLGRATTDVAQEVAAESEAASAKPSGCTPGHQLQCLGLFHAGRWDACANDSGCSGRRVHANTVSRDAEAARGKHPEHDRGDRLRRNRDAIPLRPQWRGSLLEDHTTTPQKIMIRICRGKHRKKEKSCAWKKEKVTGRELHDATSSLHMFVWRWAGDEARFRAATCCGSGDCRRGPLRCIGRTSAMEP